jgi:dinuclear metal center YbgI/SA1388 family protein
MPAIKDIIQELENWAPPALQESYDNVGLLTGDKTSDCTGVLVTLDSLPETIDEAIEKGCNLVVAHHPIVFKGLKKFTGDDYVQQTIIKAIKHDIAVYAIHTNLDNVINGVNSRIADLLELTNRKILREKSGDLLKLVVFVPYSHVEQVKDAVFNAGAGHIGNYSECSFSLEGSGTFKPETGARPFTGELHQRSLTPEHRLEVILPSWKKQAVFNAFRQVHPYEEVAYDLYRLENNLQTAGSGLVGELAEPIDFEIFIQKLKEVFHLKVVKHTVPNKKFVQKIALCGGAGFFLLKDAICSKSDIYITSDVKYHEFFDAVGKIVLADIGHYESEQFTIDLLAEHLSIKFPNFAVLKTGLNTNPVRYS